MSRLEDNGSGNSKAEWAETDFSTTRQTLAEPAMSIDFSPTKGLQKYLFSVS
jgi:hypothetical protein